MFVELMRGCNSPSVTHVENRRVNIGKLVLATRTGMSRSQGAHLSARHVEPLAWQRLFGRRFLLNTVWGRLFTAPTRMDSGELPPEPGASEDYSRNRERGKAGQRSGRSAGQRGPGRSTEGAKQGPVDPQLPSRPGDDQKTGGFGKTGRRK